MLSFCKRVTAILAVFTLAIFASTSFAASLTMGGDPATFSNLKQLVPRSDLASQNSRMDVLVEFKEAAQPTCEALHWNYQDKPYFALVWVGAQAGVCYTNQIRITNAYGGCHADTAPFGTNWGPEYTPSPNLGTGCTFKLNGVDYSSMVTAVTISKYPTPPMPSAGIQVDLAKNVVCSVSGTPEAPPLQPAEPVTVYLGTGKERAITGINNWRRYGVFDNVVSLHLENTVECHYRAR